MEKISSFRGDKLEFCLVVIKFRHDIIIINKAFYYYIILLPREFQEVFLRCRKQITAVLEAEIERIT